MRTRHLLVLAALCFSIAFIKADFGQAIVDEAVDLFAAQQGDDKADPRSMEDLLHWAIAHSDPEKLAAEAEEAQRIQMVKDLKEQRRRVKELLDHVRSQTTETDMMKEGIEILRRADASDTELLAALQALQVLVEPIDNANDLKPLGGIAPVVAQLTRGSAALAAAAAHVLGTAASNNPTFQRALLAAHPDVVATLLQVSQAFHQECAVKGMYALASLVRNLQEARRTFVEAGGSQVLGTLLREEAVAARVKRKALSLFMDLVDTQPAVAAAPDDDAAGGSRGSSSSSPRTAAEGGGSGGADAPNFRTLHLDGNDPMAATAAVAGTAGGSDAAADVGGTSAAAAASVVGSGLPEAVVSLLLQDDADMQEKALLVVQRLAADPEARRVLQSHGAGEAVADLQRRLRASAPEPGDEPDPYHDYLQDLAQQVAALLAHTSQSTGRVAGGPVGASRRGAGAGRETDAREQGRGREGAGVAGGGVEGHHQVLALGGPVGRGKAEGKGEGSGRGRDQEGQCGVASEQCAAVV